jgi:hypothetical protein
VFKEVLLYKIRTINNKKMKRTKKLLFLFLLLCTTSLLAQDKTETVQQPKPVSKNSISGQFDELYRKSGNYQEYKVVNKDNYISLKTIVLDSIQYLNKKIAGNTLVINRQKAEIDSLKVNLKKTNDSLIEVTKNVDDIEGFGVPMKKSNYNVLVYSLLAGLLGLALFFILRYRQSNKLTNQAQKALKDTEEEFDNYKRVAIEREQKVRRELQDEINKQKNIKKPAK